MSGTSSYDSFVRRYYSADFLIGESVGCKDSAIQAVSNGAFGGLEKRFLSIGDSFTPRNPSAPAVLVEGWLDASTLDTIRAIRQGGYADVWVLSAVCEEGQCDVYGFFKVLPQSPTVEDLRRRVSNFRTAHPTMVGMLRFHG